MIVLLHCPLPCCDVLISTKFNEFKIHLLRLYSITALPSTIALHQVHWLPVKQCIHFKIATVTLQSGSPSYLSSLINLNNLPRPLRSASLSLLAPRKSFDILALYKSDYYYYYYYMFFYRKGRQSKAFRFAALTIWNSIPQNISLLPVSYTHLTLPTNREV